MDGDVNSGMYCPDSDIAVGPLVIGDVIICPVIVFEVDIAGTSEDVESVFDVCTFEGTGGRRVMSTSSIGYI